MDLYCPCAMCAQNRGDMQWKRGGDERDVRTSDEIRRLMRARPFRMDAYKGRLTLDGATLKVTT